MFISMCENKSTTKNVIARRKYAKPQSIWFGLINETTFEEVMCMKKRSTSRKKIWKFQMNEKAKILTGQRARGNHLFAHNEHNDIPDNIYSNTEWPAIQSIQPVNIVLFLEIIK